MSEVRRILSAIEQGNPSAADQLLPLVYDELRKLAAQRLAQEKPGHPCAISWRLELHNQTKTLAKLDLEKLLLRPA
jgi:hypothetical protein